MKTDETKDVAKKETSVLGAHTSEDEMTQPVEHPPAIVWNRLSQETSFSRYFSFLLFVTFPCLALLVGFRYGQVNMANHQEPAVIIERFTKVASCDTDPAKKYSEADAMLLRLSGKHDGVFGELEPYEFEWSWLDETQTASYTPYVAHVSGSAIFVDELRMPNVEEPISTEDTFSKLELSGGVMDFFLERNFVVSLRNTNDSEDKSVQGFEDSDANIVCVREWQDTGTEFLKYVVACGEKPSL